MKISRLSLVAVGLATAFFCQKALAQTPDFWKNKVSPELRTKLQTGERTDFFVVMAEQADISGAKNLMGKTAKAQYVFERLQAVASRSQANVTQVLRQNGAFFNSLYLVNALAVQGGDLALAQTVAALPEVKRLALDPEVHFAGSVATADPASEAQNRGAIEWGINMINAPAVWALGYTGQGITVGGADTGYEWGHPAIKNHYRGYSEATGATDHNYNWHDAIHEASPLNGDNNNPCGFDSKQPCDDNNHGTHTMGTMTGDDGQGNQIGVAPGAKWVGCRNMERGWGKPSSYIECIEWFLAPTDLDGQNPDVSRAPHVINNSWYCSEEEGCVDTTVNNLIRTAIVNLRASGVVVVVSNGNFAQGGQCFTTRWAPAYFEESFSVGATDEADEITGFSSRGPIDIDGSNRIKPNVSAPGANVRSCVRGGDYANFWGTSMAGPHVAGLVALVLSAAPELAGNVDVIEDIIESTAVEKFDPTACGGAAAVPNNAYGRGRINALAAVQVATSLNAPDVPGKRPASAQVFPNPAGERAIFDLKNFSGKAQLRIFDAAGRQLFGQNFAAQPRQLLEIPTQQLPEGVYFWQIRDEAQTVVGRLVRG